MIRRVLVFVDESNVVSAVRAMERKLDWLKLRDHLVNAGQGRELIEMVIYAGLPPPMPEWQTERDKTRRRDDPERGPSDGTSYPGGRGTL